MSYVVVFFELLEYIVDVDVMGMLCLFEAICFFGLEKKICFYQVFIFELYGLVQEILQKEIMLFYLRFLYVVVKLYVYWIIVNYCEFYGMYVCNGIFFNYEFLCRGEIFVICKIICVIVNIVQGLELCLYFGNMDFLCDWGYVKDYVKMQWMML